MSTEFCPCGDNEVCDVCQGTNVGPDIESTDRFCEHGNPAEMPCLICKNNGNILAALEDFKAISQAFITLSRSFIAGYQRMGEAMAKFENEHGENLRVLLHDAKERQVNSESFGTKVAGGRIPVRDNPQA